MPPSVKVVRASPRLIAAVRRRVELAEISTAFKPALDQVWAFLRARPDLHADGHNIFLYHHTTGNPETGMDVDFGVEVTGRFEPEGQSLLRRTPAGRAARAIHRGRYQDLSAAHAAVHKWVSSNGEKIGGWSCEIYGDWSDNERKLKTTVIYGLG